MRSLRVAAASVALALVALALAPLADAAQRGRVVVIGFDGGDFATVNGMVERGEAPNFARLRGGTFAPLESTQPAESPTAWASLNTGQNPSKTGVPGFVQRVLDGGAPNPSFGHIELLEGESGRPLAEIEEVPIPRWDARTYTILGGAAVFLVLLGLLLAVRVRAVLALPIAIVAAGLGGFSAQRLRGWLPERYPVTANPNQEKGFWDLAAEGGLRAVVVNAAQAWDQRNPKDVELLAGLGVPDARGGLGDWFIYSADEGLDRIVDDGAGGEGQATSTAGRVITVDDRGGRIESKLLGPHNFWREEQVRARMDVLQAKLDNPKTGYKESVAINEELTPLYADLRAAQRQRVSVPLRVERTASTARITIGEQTQELREGQWSDWYEVEFSLNPLVSVHAVTRVKLLKLDSPHFELFVSRLDIDPAKPTFWQPISAPLEFSRALAAACGTFETYGWSTLTMPFKDKKINAATLLEDVEFTLKWRERLVMHAFEKDDWDVFVGIFSTTDRTQHMTYAHHDAEHPAHDPVAAAERVTFFGADIPVSDAIPAIYVQADRVLGRIIDGLRPDDLLIVVSDHGFQSFRWQVDVNHLLAQLGYLVLRDDLEGARRAEGEPFVPGKRFRGGSFLSGYADWSKSRAYSLGMGAVYLNQVGREAAGIVSAAERRAVLEEMKAALLAYRDPKTGAQLVSQVILTEDDRSGPHADREPDLMVGFASTYGPAWSSRGGGAWLVETEAGGVAFDALVKPNDNPWSGDHVGVDTRNVLGLFLSNQRFNLPEDGVPHVLDVAPTVLEFMGIPRPAALDREPLQRVQ